MAFLIPENIASRSDLPRSLQTVARSFRDGLSDDVTVWLEEDDHGHLLIVFDPSLGIAVIDVIAGSAGRTRSIGARRRTHDNPDLSKRVQAIRSGLETRADTSGLPVIGALGFPATSDSSAMEQAAALPYLRQSDLSVDRIASSFEALFGSKARPSENTPAVRAVVKPDIVIRTIAAEESGQLTFQEPQLEAAEIIRVLDREQEQVARDLGAGYRVIRGVAGSGKTLILTFRARHLAENFPNRKVLLACFNVVLAESLKASTGELTNLDVYRVDQIVSRLAGPIRGNSTEAWDEARSRALEIQRRNGRIEYDVVLVDEGQDLTNDQLDLMYELLSAGRDDFVIALDGAQSIYRRRASWNPPGLTARGRTRILRVNYRNTREILEFAHEFLTDGQDPAFDPDSEDPDVIIPPEATRRSGPWPTVVATASVEDEVATVGAQVERLLADGVEPGSIGVITGSKTARTRLYFEMRSRDIPYYDVAYGKNRYDVMSHVDTVRASTIHSFKGLEFSRIFLLGVNQLPVAHIESGAYKRLLYVAMTRAMDELFIAVSGTGPAGDSLIALSQNPVSRLEVQSAQSARVPPDAPEILPRELPAAQAADSQGQTEFMCAGCDVANQAAEIENPKLPNACIDCGSEITGRCEVCGRFVGESSCEPERFSASITLTPHLAEQAERLHFTSAEIQRVLSQKPTRRGPNHLMHRAPGAWITRPDTSMAIDRLGRS